MKKGLLLFLVLHLFVLSCTSTRPVVDNSAVLKDYQQPFKIFGVGYAEPGYNILTLTDANNKYVVIKERQKNTFKVGDIYNP